MSLSGGQKQRVAICQAYLSDRDILLFDEPTSGLDFVHMKKTAEMIKEIARDKTVFIITHDMELVDECCTHILKLGGNTITGDYWFDEVQYDDIGPFNAKYEQKK